LYIKKKNGDVFHLERERLVHGDCGLAAGHARVYDVQAYGGADVYEHEPALFIDRDVGYAVPVPNERADL